MRRALVFRVSIVDWPAEKGRGSSAGVVALAAADSKFDCLEPLAVSFSSGGPKAAIAPRGIYDDVGVFQTVS
jgi:hypothetical protein